MQTMTLARADGKKVNVDFWNDYSREAPYDNDLVVIALPRKHLRYMTIGKDARETLDIAYGLVGGQGFSELRSSLLLDAGRTVLQYCSLDRKEIGHLTEQIIKIYDFQNLYQVTPLQEAAVELCTELAIRHPSALEKVIESAARYGRMLDIEDADPYHPNSYDLLARIPNDRVADFLAEAACSKNMMLSVQGKDSLREHSPKHPLLAAEKWAGKK